MPKCFLKGVSMPYPTKCDRCRQSMSDCCMSKFNSDYICGTLHSNRHLSNLGYDSMTTEMKNIFNSIACNPVSDRNV